jgi:hypothetical protein
VERYVPLGEKLISAIFGKSSSFNSWAPSARYIRTLWITNAQDPKLILKIDNYRPRRESIGIEPSVVAVTICTGGDIWCLKSIEDVVRGRSTD